jgi:hypothetical protein
VLPNYEEVRDTIRSEAMKQGEIVE